MRHETLLIGGTILAVMAIACDKASSITGPEAPYAVRADALTSHLGEQDIPWAVTEPNPCNDDVVTSDGTAHFVFGSTVDNSGGTHLSTQFSFRGSGTGAPSLLAYTLSEQQSTSEQQSVPQDSWLEEEIVIVKPPRPELTYMRHMVFKFTMNATGIPTASFERSFNKCGGETIDVGI